MKTLGLAGALLVSVSMAFAEPAPVAAAKAEVKSQTLCPVMGGKISEKVFADYQGERVYFCCKGCIAAFNKEPEKYLKKMKEQGVTPAKAPEMSTKK